MISRIVTRLIINESNGGELICNYFDKQSDFLFLYFSSGAKYLEFVSSFWFSDGL